MSRPLLLDLFCGAGGAAKGYHDAGFDVVGVDLNPMPRFPYEFVQMDALEYMETQDLSRFSAIHASPPCQNYSVGSARWRAEGYVYPDLIAPTREALIATGLPYVIENVSGARKHLINPVRLCGQTFGLGVVRHRYFETNWFLLSPTHVRCVGAVTRDLVSVTGHGPPGRWYRAVTVAGHGGNSRSFKLSTWKEAMGIDWMSRDELVESIPPAYTRYIGAQLLRVIEGVPA